MKAMKTINTVTIMLVALSLSGSAWGQEGQQVSIPLSDPDRPMTLRASLLSGGISVQGYDGKEVLVEVRPLERADEDRRRQGMQRIPNTSLGLTIEEEGNHVSIKGSWITRLLFLNNNFHKAHHSFPRVPWYRLPALQVDTTDDAPSYAGLFAHYLLRVKQLPVHPATR